MCLVNLTTLKRQKSSMEVSFKYGSEKLTFDFRDSVELLNITEPEFNITREDFCSKFKLLLHQTNKDFTNVGVVIADKTRLCDYPLYLPWFIETLENEGAQKESITFYISYGTHPKQTDNESFSSYGSLFEKYRFIHHDCNDLSIFKNLGKTKKGTPALVRKDILESSLIITFGAISHHYFAGFGGGRKLLFPGLGEKKAIYHNHSLFLDMENKKLQPGCKPGKLDGNPLAEDLREIDEKLPPKISIHGILNSAGKVCQFLFGKNYNDFIHACNIHDGFYKSGIKKEYDMVIASSGGYPKDLNFIQAHKSIHHSSAFVKDGGILIVLAECIDGIGNNAFLPLFKEGGWNEMFEKLSQKYEGNGGTALAMKAKTTRIQIYMLTELDEEACSLMGARKTSISEIRLIINNHAGTLALIKNASMLVK